jgi:hypothetical protein
MNHVTNEVSESVNPRVVSSGLPSEMSEQDLHGVVVWLGQLTDQLRDGAHTLLVVGAFCGERDSVRYG